MDGATANPESASHRRWNFQAINNTWVRKLTPMMYLNWRVSYTRIPSLIVTRRFAATTNTNAHATKRSTSYVPSTTASVNCWISKHISWSISRLLTTTKSLEVLKIMWTPSSAIEVANIWLTWSNLYHRLSLRIQTTMWHKWSSKRHSFTALELFMKCRETAAFNICSSLHFQSHKHQNEGTVTLYLQAVNYLLEVCATDDEITERDAHVMQFSQPLSRMPRKYAVAS